MATTHNAPLSSAEIAQIWASYQEDTMSICTLRYFLETVEDPDITALLQHALELSQSHIPQLTDFFNGENWPVPKGFTEADVNLSAPRLYTDGFMLMSLLMMGIVGVNGYSAAVGSSVRFDVHDYYSRCMSETVDLHKQAVDLLLEKGMFVRAPEITPPDQIDFVTNHDFLGKWMGDNRPLTAMETGNLYANSQRNIMGKSLLIGFSQVAQDPEIRKHMVKGKEIAEKHVDVFSSKLNQDDLPASTTSDAGVTDATVAPFSDKLMMFYTSGLIATSIGYYGTAMAMSPRKDLITDYSRLTAEIMKYSAESAKIMIDYGWMEEPPKAKDRDQLAQKKNQ
ncbi:DUF3231 family protein [Salicibibacter halophilus]|uniref:DUF3231 family protein n=1 Tax=Salicibibacter halophilus TaxID=2502791 RepID=A0A514LKY8_9BACI|nr:DUF3231 family protein [Salicibibacter halophilus]QDI92512.1 DUF3231 family protein [Salicibibacter halophilus]